MASRELTPDVSDEDAHAESDVALSTSESEDLEDQAPALSIASSIEELKREAASLLRERERLWRARLGQKGAIVLSWREMATRHAQARSRAERLNSKLKLMMDSQQAAVEDLFRAIQQADNERQAAEASAVFAANVDTPSRFYQHRLPLMQDGMLKRLDRIVQDWHVPFDRCTQFKNPANFIDDLLFMDVNVIRDDDIEGLVEIYSSSVLPFPAKTVEAALWGYFTKVRCTSDEFSMAIDGAASNESSMDARIVVSSRQTSVSGTISSPSVWRNFRTDDGDFVMVASCSGSLNVERPSRHQTEALLCEDSYLRVCTVRLGSTPVTAVQHVRRSRFSYTGCNRPSRAQIGAVKTLINNVIKSQLDYAQEELEQSLMASHRASSCS